MVKYIVIPALLGAIIGLRLIFEPKSEINWPREAKVKITGVIERASLRYSEQRWWVKKYEVRYQGEVEAKEGDEIEAVGMAKTGSDGENFIKAETVVIKKPNRLVRWKQTWLAKLDSWLPPQEAAIAKGIVWGEQSDLSWQVKQTYKSAGLSHLLVASGFNVSLLAMGLEVLTRGWMSRRLRIYFVSGCIILYGLFLGYGIPVIRAVILVIMVYLAKLLGRRTSGGYVLILVGLALLVINPEWRESISFQLSFLATAGLVYAQKTRFAVINLIAEPFWVVIFTLPILIYNFGVFNLLSIPANVLVEPLISPLSEIVIAANIFGSGWNLLGQLLAWMSWPILKMVTFVAAWTANQKWAILNVELNNVVIWLTYYFGLLVYLSRRNRRAGSYAN